MYVFINNFALANQYKITTDLFGFCGRIFESGIAVHTSVGAKTVRLFLWVVSLARYPFYVVTGKSKQMNIL